MTVPYTGAYAGIPDAPSMARRIAPTMRKGREYRYRYPGTGAMVDKLLGKGWNTAWNAGVPVLGTAVIELFQGRSSARLRVQAYLGPNSLQHAILEFSCLKPPSLVCLAGLGIATGRSSSSSGCRSLGLLLPLLVAVLFVNLVIIIVIHWHSSRRMPSLLHLCLLLDGPQSLRARLVPLHEDRCS